MNLKLKEIEQAIKQIKPQDQQKLISDLPVLLNISSVDFALLKLSEKSFSFWDNEDDAVYDDL